MVTTPNKGISSFTPRVSNVRTTAFGVMFHCFGMSITAMATAAEPIDPTVSSPTQAAAKSAYHNQLICKTKTVVGSYIPKRICKTQAQLDADRERAQRALREVQAPHPVSGGEAVRPNG